MREREVLPHFISVGQFKQQPIKIEPFRSLDIVTRENFVPFLVKNFAVAKGSFTREEIHLIWLQIKIGFDYKTTFNNFLLAGGWNCFSEGEKYRFLRAFNSIEAHRREQVDIAVHANPALEIEDSIRELLNTSGEKGHLREREIGRFINEHGPLHGHLINLSEKELVELMDAFPFYR